jgi:hypothetical protein
VMEDSKSDAADSHPKLRSVAGGAYA